MTLIAPTPPFSSFFSPQAQAARLAEMAKHYNNILYNSAITFMEIFPVGLIVTLVSATILRRKPRQGAPAAAMPA